jgi:outer membrane protein assembly factor BamB
MSKINNNKIKIYDVKKGEKRVNKEGVKHNFELIFLVSLLFIILLAPAIFTGSSDSEGTSEWRMFHRTLNHTGVYPEAVNMHNFGLLWKYTTGGDVLSSPAVVNDIVYISSSLFDTRVYALNATEGNEIWNYTVAGNHMLSSPAIANSIAYIGSSDYNVYALNATGGNRIWNYTTGNYVYSSPAVVNDIVYIGCDDYSIYALNATNGSLIWRYITEGIIRSSPAIANDIVYVGSYDNNVYALNATDGGLIWSYATGDWIDSSPAVANDIVYIGSWDNNLYALNATDGSQIWNYTTTNIIRYLSPAIINNIVYVGSDNDKIYALNATNGSYIWHRTTTGDIRSSPAIANDIIYIGSSNNKMYVLNATNGGLIWSYTTGNDVLSSPAIANGIVYIGSYDDKVYAFMALEIPTVNLIEPINDTNTTNSSIIFSCDATDNYNITNITLYIWNSTGSLYYSNTQNTAIGDSWYNQSSWSVTDIQNGTYEWNCLAYDNSSNSAWANSNWTFNLTSIYGEYYINNFEWEVNTTNVTSSTINQSTIQGIPVVEITNSYIYNSTLTNVSVIDNCTVLNSVVTGGTCVNVYIDPSEIIESDTTGSTIKSSHIQYSNATYSTIIDSSIGYSDLINSQITNSTLNNSILVDSNLTSSNVTNSTLDNITAINSTITNSILANSVILNMDVTDVILEDSGVNEGHSSGGGGGGYGSNLISECAENWLCDDWSPCINNFKTRSCRDLNLCGTAENKPIERMLCSAAESRKKQGETGEIEEKGFRSVTGEMVLHHTKKGWEGIAISAGIIFFGLLGYLFLRRRL